MSKYHNSVFEYFDSLPHRDQECHLYMICILVKYKCMLKDFVYLGWERGDNTSLKIISVSYMFNREIIFSTQIFKKEFHQSRKQILR